MSAVVGQRGSADAFGLQGDFVVIGLRSDSSEQGGIVVIRLDAAGTILGPPEILQTLPGDEVYSGASFAMTPAGRLLAAYSRWADNPYNAPRIHGQMFALVPLMPGDIDGDGDVDEIDRLLFVGVLLGTDTNPDHVARSDLNGDENEDGNDIPQFVAALLGS